ncbi:MAG: thermonuclease family protein [Nanoarchaeota archaeon]|nr:thermonuclease family protein [Nanoarchaeota archaeon]
MERRTILTLSLLSLLFLLILASYIISNKQANTYNTTNSLQVIDGDTFTYQGKTIRLLCVDTPELGEEGYEEASNFLFQLISNQNLTIEEEGLDKYNRTLAWVYTEEDTLVNKKIIDNGLGNLFIYEGTNCSKLNS